MANIVRIGPDTLRDNCQIGDIVAIHDDDVKLEGAGYEGFDILHIENLKAEDILSIIRQSAPEQAKAFKLPMANTWTFEQPEEQQVWKNSKDGLWYKLVEHPKYQTNLNGVTELDKTTLSDSLVASETKIAILNSKINNNVSKNAFNLTLVNDLNKDT